MDTFIPSQIMGTDTLPAAIFGIKDQGKTQGFPFSSYVTLPSVMTPSQSNTSILIFLAASRALNLVILFSSFILLYNKKFNRLYDLFIKELKKK